MEEKTVCEGILAYRHCENKQIQTQTLVGWSYE